MRFNRVANAMYSPELLKGTISCCSQRMSLTKNMVTSRIMVQPFFKALFYWLRRKIQLFSLSFHWLKLRIKDFVIGQ